MNCALLLAMHSPIRMLRCHVVCILVMCVAGPCPLVAQATNPAYLREFPTADRVLATMQAQDPDETAARQMGAFWQLKKMIEDMAGPRVYSRTNGLTADELRRRGEYYTAYVRIQQSKPQYKSFTAMRGYDVSPQFRNEMLRKLLPPTFAAEYGNATGQSNAQFQAMHQARVLREQQQQEAAQAANAEAQANAEANQAVLLDVARCRSTGKSENECTLRAVGKGLTDTFQTAVPNFNQPTNPGVYLYLRGEYAGQNSSVSFYSDSMTGVTCGDLMPESHNYTIKIGFEKVLV